MKKKKIKAVVGHMIQQCLGNQCFRLVGINRVVKAA